MKRQSTINEPLIVADIIPKDILVESSTDSILVNITKNLDRYSVEGWNRRRMKYSSLAKGHARYSISSYDFGKGYRNAKNIKGFGQVLLLDFDKGRPTLEEAIESVKNAGLRAVICPSKSHQKQKNDEPPCDRLHIILFLDEELHDAWTSSNEVKQIDNSLQTLSAMVFDGAILDNNALGSARFFGATFNEDGIYIDGKVIDSQKFLSLADLNPKSIEDSEPEEDNLSILIKKKEQDSFYSNYPEIEWSIQKFNNPKSLKKILEKEGYTYSGKNGNEYRLFRPDYTSDKPSVVISKNDDTGSWYVYHHSGNLQGKTLDAFGLIKELRFNGDFRQAQAYTLKRYEEKKNISFDIIMSKLDKYEVDGGGVDNKTILKDVESFTQKQFEQFIKKYKSWLDRHDYKHCDFNVFQIEALVKEKIAQTDPWTLLSKYQLTTVKAEKHRQMRFLYDGVVPEGMHIYLVGSAGAGKTTIAYHLMKTMAQGYPEKKFIFFYLDGAQSMAGKIVFDLQDGGLNNVQIVSEGSANDFNNILKSFVKNGSDLSSYVFFYDTFKYLTKDINGKSANKEAMHHIKDLTKLGATFISLGHTNKDGKRESGTAEIEQDSDGVIRADSIKGEEGKVTTSLSKGGRCRFDFVEKSFTYTAGDPTTVKPLNDFMNIEAGNKDNEVIADIKKILSEGAKSQSEILIISTQPERALKRVLKEYTGFGYWAVTIGDKNKHIYSLYIEDDFK